MSGEEQTYCRLCAELTPKDQLISTEEAVGVNSKIAKKMHWININTLNSPLPNTICFDCFDNLERTWRFLNVARSAQTKLRDVYMKKQNEIDLTEAGKPVDIDWELYEPIKTEIKSEGNSLEHIRNNHEIDLTRDRKSYSIIWESYESSKVEVKNESNSLLNTHEDQAIWDRLKENKADVKNESGLLEITIADQSVMKNVDLIVKKEQINDDCNYSDGHNSTDSDLPLLLASEKKKGKRKKKSKTDLENTISNSQSLTWDGYMSRCAYCDALCKNITSLRLHTLQIHSCCCCFMCSECGKVISNYRLFLKHVRLHKKFLRRCCEFCNKSFSSSSLLKIHINTHHCNAYLLMCQTCGASFDSPELLQDHIILYNRKFKKHSVKCDQTLYDLKCQLCSKEFKTKSNLQQHKLVHMKRTREFSCHVCGKMFFTKGSLSTHITTHEDSKPFKCEFCPMAFRARGNLQSHKSLHSGVKPFVCEQCGKSFRVKRHLKSHLIVHTDLMPYICEYCNKTFRFKTRLNLHLRQHTGVKPYKCVLCQRDFTNGSNYKKHMRCRHNIDTSKKKYNNVVNLENKNEITSQS